MNQFYMPVKVIQGEKCVMENADLFRAFGKKALVVTGRNSARMCGALEDVTKALAQNGQQYVLYDQVMSNPTVACVYDGAALARREQTDFVIAIGGGSPMDAAKAMAMLAVNDVAPEDIFSGMQGKKALPMIHIPTTAGTGSEVTPYAILTNDAKETKTSISSADMFPKIALLDARYLQYLSHRSMVHTVLDSLSHSMEGMLSVRASGLTDGMALEAIGRIGRLLDELAADSLSRDDCESLLLASALGGMVIANTGTTIVHSMGYSLTYFHGTDHGRANALLLPTFLKLAGRSHADRVDRMLDAAGFADVEQLAGVIDGLLGERERLTNEEIERYTRLAANPVKLKNCVVPVTTAQIRRMFQESLGETAV